MSESSSTATGRKRRPLLFILGGTALLFLCVLFACVANAAYWTYKMSGSGAAEAPPVAIIRAESEALPAGSAADGEQLFTNEGGCPTCHSLQPGEQIVGPSLAGVSVRAATTRPGYSAEMYLYESIAYPNAYDAADFTNTIMPLNFKERFTSQQMGDLIAFLMTQ
jgi:cytochrome c2